MLKADTSNGFYQIGLRLAYAPKIGLILPIDDDAKPLVAIPLILPMGWKNSSPLFCTATKNAADLANQAFCAHSSSWPHKMDDRESSVVSAAYPTLDPTLVPLSQAPLNLHTNTQLLAYEDVFVDDFLGLLHSLSHRRRHVHRTLFCALDKVFRPLEKLGSPQTKEALFLKKLDSGDCLWSTYQFLIGWVVDTVNMMLCFPTHRAACLKEILSRPP